MNCISLLAHIGNYITRSTIPKIAPSKVDTDGRIIIESVVGVESYKIGREH